MFTAPPNLAHEARTDNPHQVTAAQVGAYTKQETDDLRSALQATISAQISNLQTQINNLQTQMGQLTVTATGVNRWIG